MFLFHCKITNNGNICQGICKSRKILLFLLLYLGRTSVWSKMKHVCRKIYLFILSPLSPMLDAKDLEILRILQQDGRLTTKEMAARVNLSTTPRLRAHPPLGAQWLHRALCRHPQCRKTQSGLCRVLFRQTEAGQ